jgi:myxalamid-type polyketide synthase MxaE and MxaD
VVVLPADWAAFARARAGRALPLYRRVLGAQAEVPGAGLAGRLAGAGPEERRRLVEGAVRECLGRVLKLAPARIDPRRSFGAMGLSSLLAMELRNRLEAALGRPLSATLAWNYPTVAALAAHLAGDGEAAAPAPAESAPAGRSEALAEIAQLSDEEAALALRASRTRGGR